MIDSILSRMRKRFPPGKGTPSNGSPDAPAVSEKPADPPKDALSRQDLASLRAGLSAMSAPALREFYRKAHDRCRLDGDRVPKPSDIQGLVQAWRQLRGEK